jgi:hypothetical protein
MERQEFDPSLSRARFSGEMGTEKKKVDREMLDLFFCFSGKMYSSISSLSLETEKKKKRTHHFY